MNQDRYCCCWHQKDNKIDQEGNDFVDVGVGIQKIVEQYTNTLPKRICFTYNRIGEIFKKRKFDSAIIGSFY